MLSCIFSRKCTFRFLFVFPTSKWTHPSSHFGSVFAATYRSEHVVVKIVRDHKDCEFFFEEATSLKQLHHPKLVTFLGLVEAPHGVPQELGLIMEKLHSSLEDYVLNLSLALPFAIKLQIALDIAYGLQFLHTANFLHRDLTSSNILMVEDPLKAFSVSRMLVKICDFGLSRFGSHYTSSQSGKLLYLAPEMSRGRGSTRKSDVYSFGVLLYELLSRRRSYGNIFRDLLHPTTFPVLHAKKDAECFLSDPFIPPNKHNSMV